ncbi:MHC class II transactivator [Aulostomus maculatus]
MEEMELDPFLCLDDGDLPDDLSEFLNDDYLKKLMDSDILFDDPLLGCCDDGNGCSKDLGDFPMQTELLSPDSQQQEQKLTSQTKNRRRRTQVNRSEEKMGGKSNGTKRQKVEGKAKTKAPQTDSAGTQSCDAGSGPAETAVLCTPPQKIVHLHPSIQLFTIPDPAGYQVVQTLKLSPPVMRLSLPNTPTYIFVPASSPSYKLQLPPLSPVDDAVAPVQMSSSPPGSLSDTTSKAMSKPCASPLSSSNESSPLKESPVPRSPTVADIPQDVKNFIWESKSHMNWICQEMESHYVEVPVIQREILRSVKHTNKCLNKELVIMGDTVRQKSLLRPSQIFESLNGDKPKHYILLLGNAGMGKTILIRKLCLDWSTDCLPQFDFVFLLDGKALTLTEPSYSLQTLLLTLSSFGPPCRDLDEVYAQILASPKRVLIIFDGFDELRDYEILLQSQEKDLTTLLQRDSKSRTYTVRQLYSAILQRAVLPGCTLLLSTRSGGASIQLLRRVDSILDMCGFTPTYVESYFSKYFIVPAHRASAMDYLENCCYLRLLCWNPGLCRLVCLLLEQSENSQVLPRTLTGLCHQVLCLKMEKGIKAQREILLQSVGETQMKSSSSTPKKFSRKSRAQAGPCHRTKRAKLAKQEKDDLVTDELIVERTEQRVLLAQLSSLAWEGIKANTSILPAGSAISATLKTFGLRTGLFLRHQVTARQVISSGKRNGGGEEVIVREMEGGGDGVGMKKQGKTDLENKVSGDHILYWASPFLQSYLAGVHLSLSRSVSDRTFVLTLPFQSGLKGRRRSQREERELTQRFAVGLLFHKKKELQRLNQNKALSDIVITKKALVNKHLMGLSHGNLGPVQVLEACHCVYEASFTHGSSGSDTEGTKLAAHLAAKLPEVLTFQGVSLSPPDMFVVQSILNKGGTGGRQFSLNLEDSGIQISGLKALVALSNINTYRACIADVITLWEQLEQSDERELLHKVVSKFTIHPMKATQVCHVEDLAKLVNIHTRRRLLDSFSQSDSILAEGVPAVNMLHKLEFELGPERGPLALPKLWELLPGLQDLQHLDLENSKIGDKGAERLANALVSLCSLEILNLSQNCIGDEGVKKLATTLKDLTKLHCLSLYSNVICDGGAWSLAAVLPHMASLTELDVKYNKLTDVGVQSLAASLRNCKKIKTLRMWNQCIPCGVFERLQQQDPRILWD